MSDHEMHGGFVKQVFDLWVNPEVERRRQVGVLPTTFQLPAAQVVMNLGQPHVVLSLPRYRGQSSTLLLVSTSTSIQIRSGSRSRLSSATG